MGTPCAPLLYLGCREEGQRILDEPLDLDLHGGQRALEHGQSLQEGVGDGHRPHPSPRQHQGGCPPALYLLEGAAQALVTVQVIMNHLCRENRNISRSVPGHREPWGAQRQRGASTPGWVWGSCLSSPPPHSQLSPALISLSVWFMMNLFGATQKSLVPCGDRGTSLVPTELSTAPASPSLLSCPTHHRGRRVHGHGGPAEDEHEEPTAQHPAGRAGSTGGERGRGSP